MVKYMESVFQCCKVLHIGNKNPVNDYIMKIGDQEFKIAKCEEEKDLGVTFDKNLLFDRHITHIVNKANQRIGIIKHTFTFLDKDILLKL